MTEWVEFDYKDGDTKRKGIYRRVGNTVYNIMPLVFVEDSSNIVPLNLKGVLEIDTLNQERLEEDLINAIRQFHKYASMSPVSRNEFVVKTLEEMLEEAEKSQTELCAWENEEEMNDLPEVKNAPKYSIGQDVWYLGFVGFNIQLKLGHIRKIYPDSEIEIEPGKKLFIEYEIDCGEKSPDYRCEAFLFASREDFINHHRL